MKNGNIMIRFHVSTAQAQSIPEIKDRISWSLSESAEIISLTEEPYWKIPTHVVLTVLVECPPEESHSIAQAVAGEFSSKWVSVVDDEEKSLVWNPESTSAEGIEWANIDSFNS